MAPATAATTTALDRYDPARYNVLLPTPQLRQQLGAWHVLTVSEVQVDPDPARGDVYPLTRDDEQAGPNAKYALAKPALFRIAVAGGIIWDPRHSGFDRLDDYIAAYRAVGYLRMPDGSILPLVATKLIDLRVIATEERQRLERKAAKMKFKSQAERDRWIEWRFDAVMTQWRKSYAARAETGAMLRLVRAAFGIKAGYVRDELARPFVVPRIDFAPDMNDPAVRQWMLQRGDQALRAFGWGQVPAIGARSQAVPVASFLATAPEAPMRPPLEAPEDEPEDEASTMETVDGQATLPGTAEDAQPVEQPAEEPEQAAPTGQPPADNSTCRACGRKLSDKVREYSLSHFGEPLCMQHQPKRGGQE